MKYTGRACARIAAAVVLPVVFFSAGVETAQATTVAGVTPGQFSVNESGAAIYRIPIQVPPGVAGMEPKLELVYNSQGANGLLGLGWSLSGLSAVSRCPRTVANDDDRGGINFDMNDRYCMDGQRLILVSGTYGVAGSEYRTELDSFSRIIASGIAGNGVASFVVQAKTGLTMEYGNTADSRIEAQGKATVRVWAVNKISDVKTNIMTFGYYKSADSSAYAPLNIGYGGNTAAGLPNNQFVNFDYDTARVDKSSGYVSGSLIQNDRRITSLATYSNSSLTKTYSISYQQSPSSGRSRLLALTECATSTSCFAPVTFSYGMAANASFLPLAQWAAEYSDAGMWHVGPQYYSTIRYPDLNGDGFPDVCGRSGSGLDCALNPGTVSAFGPKAILASGFSDSLGWNRAQYFSTIRYLDLNGDGVPDVCGRGGSGLDWIVH